MSHSSKLAVVGLGCILPDANSPSEFWTNTLRGHSALRPLSSRMYEWSCYGRESGGDQRLFDGPIGAQIGDHPFDWRKFKISPLDAQGINPMHLHVLEAGAQAIDDMRFIPHLSAGVFIGGTGLGWRRDSGLRIRLPDFLDAADQAGRAAGLSDSVRQSLLERVHQSLDRRLRPVNDDGVVNALASIAAGRLSLRFDLRGPHAGIDAGFASGLAAVATAARLLLDGTIDLAIAGGASECISPLDLISFQQLGVLAPHHVRPFDAGAQGTLLGEGVVLFAIKRLQDALEHGERIYAVIRGTGASSDGRSRSLLAPSVEGQTIALRQAYAEAEIDPSTIGYVECHATGTPIGDATELHALSRVFDHAAPGIAVASAKPFVGHLRGASGAVGLLRAVLAVHHRTLAAQIGFETPHPNLELHSTPFFVPTEQVALEPRPGAQSVRAAVSSFGLGGVNYHVVLEAFEPEPPGTRAAASVGAQQPKHDEPIAIIGLGGVLPNAENVSAFWQSLVDGLDATREVPTSRWQVDRYFDADQKRLDASYTRIGCFVEPLPGPSRNLRVPPIAGAHIDPGHVIAFRAAEEAIADAQLESTDWDRSRTAVVFGFIPCQGRRHLAEARLNFREFETELEQTLLAGGVDPQRVSSITEAAERVVLADLPAITEDTLPGFLGSFNAARIARYFDLHGPHFTVESACASSLAALQAGARLLQQGKVDTVVLGGVWADGQPEFFVQNCRFSALSATGITPFDERASGFVPGEGAAVLVLRRLSDAEREGQRIHAVIRSIEGSTDGAAGRSIYSPSAEGESLAARRALEVAGLDPSQVDYVECHGTGTALGDVVEVEACTRAYGSGRERPLLVGSVKSNIGHLMAGAGAAALLKTTLALREGIIPASIKVEKLNPKIDFQTGPVKVVTQTQNWSGPGGQPRRAGVSGFGLGGTNFHALLEEYRSPNRERVTPGNVSSGKRSQRVLPVATVQGKDAASCVQAMRSISAQVQRGDLAQFWSLIEANQAAAAGDDPCRLAIVAEDPSMLIQREALLASAFSKGHDLSVLRAKGVFFAESDPERRVAALFPGQGPQYANMLCEASKAFPELSQALDRIDRAYESICGRKLRSSYCTDDPDTYLQSDEDIHCAVFGVNVALFELLQTFGARFDAVMGQSAGELSALVAARSITLEDGLRAIRERTLAVLGINSPDPGRMVTLACGAERALRFIQDLPGYAALAADNGPSACIVSGNRAAVDALIERAAVDGIRATVLPVSHGYHSQLIASARPRYRQALDSIQFKHPGLDFFSTITGTKINDLPLGSYPLHLESQFVEPVRLRQAVIAMHRSGVRVFVECGPKWPLTTFVSEILTGLPYVAHATVHPKVGEVEQLQRALACLFVHRVCSLTPVRKFPMSVQNSSDSKKPASAIHNDTNGSLAGREVTLLDTLRAARDLIDNALNGYESAEEDTEAVSESGLDMESGLFNCLPERELVTAPASDVALEPDASASASCDVREQVGALLISELMKRTGYPEDMLEPDLDLEAELGIDTVKQVASLAAVREHFGLAPDPAFRMQDARSLRQAVDYLVARIRSANGGGATAPAGHGRVEQNPQRPREVTAGESRARPMPASGTHPVAAAAQSTPAVASTPAASAPVASAPAATTPPAPALPLAVTPAKPVVVSDSPRSSESVARLLTTELMNRTGYPADMLEMDLDLEAELGIDTVKQVAALAAVREKFGLPPDPQFRMQDARTLRQAIEYLTGRIASLHALEGHASQLDPTSMAATVSPVTVSPRLGDHPEKTIPEQPAVAPAGEPTHVSVAELASALNELREYVHSLALLVTQNLRERPAAFSRETDVPAAHLAEPGPVTKVPSQAAPPRSIYPELLLASVLPQESCPGNGEALEVTGLTIADNDCALPPAEVESADVIALHGSDADGQIVARSRRVRLGTAVASAPPDMLAAIRDGRAAANNQLLRDYLAKCGRSSTSSIEWAHAQGFTTTVGGARMAAECIGQRAMLSLLGSCFDVASFAWFGLTGALHSLSGIERLCFHSVPKPGDEMLICAHMAHPKGGFWRADVVVLDAAGNLFAQISGMEGTPMASLGLGEPGLCDPAERAWRRFAHRMGRDSAAPEELAS